jgi:hypothetical protein
VLRWKFTSRNVVKVLTLAAHTAQLCVWVCVCVCFHGNKASAHKDVDIIKSSLVISFVTITLSFELDYCLSKRVICFPNVNLARVKKRESQQPVFYRNLQTLSPKFWIKVILYWTETWRLSCALQWWNSVLSEFYFLSPQTISPSQSHLTAWYPTYLI